VQRDIFKFSLLLLTGMFKATKISEFLHLRPKSTNYRKCFVSFGVSALFLPFWEGALKYINAYISTSFNLKRALKSSAFEVLKDAFSCCCLEVFAHIRVGGVCIG